MIRPLMVLAWLIRHLIGPALGIAFGVFCAAAVITGLRLIWKLTVWAWS